MTQRFDPKILELIPHRPPMLLINELLEVRQNYSSASVIIDSETPFFHADKGVPAWIGLEYMGQTAALIAGYQVQQGLSEPHLGFLMGSRKYDVKFSHFTPQSQLTVVCEEGAVVGNSCLLYTSPSPRDQRGSRMPSSA